MVRHRSKPKKAKAKMDESALSSDLSNLAIDDDESLNFFPPMMALSEFYYPLGLCEAETTAQLMLAGAPKAQQQPGSNDNRSGGGGGGVSDSPRKKKKKDDRVVERVESVTGKLKSLSITVQNDQQPQQAKIGSPSKKTKGKNTKDMLDHLKLLQKGEIPSSAIISSHGPGTPKVNEATAEETLEALVAAASQSPMSDLKLPKMTTMSSEERRVEIVALNKLIKEKIDCIKPRLNSVCSRQIHSSSPAQSLSAHPPAPVLPKLNIPIVTPSEENFEVAKTHVGENEIHRYTQEQLCRMQQLSTWQQVPRLLQLNICGTQFSPLDEYVLRLVSASTQQERNELILNKAQERNFISRDGPSDFTFLRPNFAAQSKLQAPPSTSESAPQQQLTPRAPSKFSDDPGPAYLKKIKKIARNDEELNHLAYHHEFIELFETGLRGLDLRNCSISDMATILVKTNYAYIVEGEIRVNQRNNEEAYLKHPKGMRDICVSKLILRKCAFHGDMVRVLARNDGSSSAASVQQLELEQESLDNDLVEISPENRNYGCVLDILEKRHSRRVIGSFASFKNIQKNRKFVMVNVRDTKVPNVRVPTRTGLPTDIELSEKLLIVVEITGWSYDQPHGRVVSIIGNKGQLKAENIAILEQNSLDPKPFEQSILKQLPADDPFIIPPKEFEYRQDLRRKCIFSIDPETARDLDDALSCEILPNGNLEVGVHISDVSYFLAEDSDLDRIVKEKATTIYLVDAVYHMLPEKLCLLCSLLPGADKLAYSVFFEMDPSSADVLNTRFTRSIVNSCGKLSYDHAQAVIDEKNQDWSDIEFPELFNGYSVADVAEVIVKLQRLALMMRAKRKANGALKIDQPKLSFQFSKDDERMEAPTDFFKYCTKDSNRLIEEFMLLANVSVAKFIKEKFPKVSLLRRHDVPSESAMKKLEKTLTRYAVQLDTSSSGALSKSMENVITCSKHPNGMNAALNLLVSKTMSRARYFCSAFGEQESDFWHYALSIPIYTHFTSPIRRYADVLVHRVLNASLGYEEITSRTPEEIQQLAEVCNVQKYNAKMAGDDSSNLYFMHFIQSLKTKTMKAAVMGIFEFNLEVVLIETGHAVKIYYKNLQQTDQIEYKTFVDSSPPYVTFEVPSLQSTMKVEFGMEISVQVEVLKDKLIINKIFYT